MHLKLSSAKQRPFYPEQDELNNLPLYSSSYKTAYREVSSHEICFTAFNWTKLEHLVRLRSEDTPAASWLPTLLIHVGFQVKTRSNDLEDIGQGQRSPNATHLLMLVIICTKYGKNPSRTVDATERTRFSGSRLKELENIGQGQRSLNATHPLILVIICAKYGKNLSRTVDFFSRSRPKNVKNLPKIQISGFWKKNVKHDTPSDDSDRLCHI